MIIFQFVFFLIHHNFVLKLSAYPPLRIFTKKEEEGEIVYCILNSADSIPSQFITA